jgi:hypothetical protein
MYTEVNELGDVDDSMYRRLLVWGCERKVLGGRAG